MSNKLQMNWSDNRTKIKVVNNQDQVITNQGPDQDRNTDIERQDIERHDTERQDIERHLILGASTGETHIQCYIKQHPNVQVVCLCQDPIVQPKVIGGVKNLDTSLLRFLFWEGNFNHREVWEELLLNFGGNSFARIIFDSSTSKFINHDFWNIKKGYFSLVVQLLIPTGQLYFDSFHLGSLCYPKTFAEDLARTGQTTGLLRLLPLVSENEVYVIQTREDLLNTGGIDNNNSYYHRNSFEALEQKVYQSEDFARYLDLLTSAEHSIFGHFTLKDSENVPYPIKNTAYSITQYLVYETTKL